MAIIDDVRFGGSSSVGSVDSVPTVVDHLKERGLEHARIGIVGGIPYQQYARLREALPDVEWHDLSGQLREQRLIKSGEEIERIRTAAALSDRSVAALVTQMQPGMSEHHLARIIDDAFMDDGGLSTVRFLISTSMHDARGGVPQQHLSPRVLQKGDVVVTELSASFWGYTGQVLRSFAIGEEPTPEYRDLHDVAEEAFAGVAAVIKEGTTIDEVLDAADVVTKRGYTIYDDFLHGAGQLTPILRTRETSRGYPEGFQFKENMCLVIQPNVVTHDGMKGVQFGEMFRVTKTGLQPMHDCPREFYVIGA
jgi:Xaa-Pro aminopeptidase